MKRAAALISLVGISAAAVPAAQDAPPNDDAAAFGALPAVYDAELSADGLHLVLVKPAEGRSTVAMTFDLVKMEGRQIARADGDPGLSYCNWTAADRVVCGLYGISQNMSVPISYSSLLSIDVNTGKQLPLGKRNTMAQYGKRYGDGYVVDWMDGVSGKVLMARSNVLEKGTGQLTARTDEGLGVDLVDTRTGKATPVERPGTNYAGFESDGLGNVRLNTIVVPGNDGYSSGRFKHSYRLKGQKEWRELGTMSVNALGDIEGIQPRAIDPNLDVAYVLQELDGRDALYRIALDGSLKSELVFASKEVDVDGVDGIGRNGRVIGVRYATDRLHIEYFDPDYKSIRASLARALPKLNLMDFMSASADESMLLVWAGSDTDPGHYYVYDRRHKALTEVMLSRPELKGKTLSPMQSISFTAADGTKVPAYLTLPPGVTEAKGLPAIVMPHGGPSARDSWGFDWLVQFYAQRGYVVVQPNYRGSAGYGDDWYQLNGFRGWKTAIGDVCDAGRWLVAQGMADPARLAIVGWSYGGYAALQANVLAPDLFKAVVAVAPVTDLSLLKNQAMQYSNAYITRDFIGSGPHVKEGSPADNASAFKAPVQMFHGDMDLNVDIAHARRMDKALRSAGKATELVVYPKLDHSLDDGTARADMLRRSDAFLRRNLGL